MAGPETAEHYARLAGSYDRTWTHSPAFVDWMAREIVAALALSPRDRVADVGCGTGLFTRRIREMVAPAAPILCVDSSEAMLAQLPADSGLTPCGPRLSSLPAGAARRAG